MNWSSGWGSPVEIIADAWKPKRISLELFVPTLIEGEVVGDLMVYQWENIWYVAHIPTETRFDLAVPEKNDPESIHNYTREQLLSWCDRVQKDKRIYWSRLAQARSETYNDDKFSETKRVIKEHCLSVPVSEKP